MSPLRVTLLIIFIVAINVPIFAASIDELQNNYDNLSTQFNKVKGLALSTLKEIKQIDTECRDNQGTPLQSKIDLARRKLIKVELLRVSFDATYQDATLLLSQTNTLLKKLDKNEPLVIKLKPSLIKINTDLSKYHRYVERYYQSVVDDFGQPITTTIPINTVGTANSKLMLVGEATAGLGTSKYERVNLNPGVNISGKDISIGLKGKYIPTDKTSVYAFVDHKTTVEQREIGLTKLGASVVQQLTPNFSATAGLDVNKYSDAENDIANFSDMGMFSRVAYQNQAKRFNINFKQVKRTYPSANSLEYTTTNFTTNATLPTGQGKIKAQLRYFKKVNEIEFMDFTELAPSLVWTFSPSGSQLAASYQQFTHPNQDSAITDNNRIKVHYHSVSRSGKSVKTWGPEVMLYQYPFAEENDYTDVKLIRKIDSRGNSYSSTRWEIAYRIYSDTIQFDFAQLQYRKNNRPIVSGKYTSFNIAARYYTEASDKDDLLRFGNVHPAHTLDFYWDFGWSNSKTGFIRKFSIGPILATRMYFDTERADAFDADFVDIDFVLLNPRNSARVGMKVGMSGVSTSGTTWRADISYIWSTLYNAVPIRSTNILELNTQINYPVNDKWAIEGYSKMHRTRADIASPADLNKFDIGIRAKYLFGLSH